MDDKSKAINIIKEALNCEESKTEKIVDGLIEAGVGLPIERAEIDKDGLLEVTSLDQRRYSVRVNKLFSVDSVKDMESNKYIYMIYQ